MPVINNRFYANPQYGKALERARAADEEFRRLHGEPQPSWLDHFLGFADANDTKRAIQTQQNRSLEQAHAKGAENDTIGNLIYNETAGLRPTSETGEGSLQNLHEARVAAGSVANTLDANAKPLGKPLTATTHLTSKEATAVRSYNPARLAYEDSQAAASEASRDKNGPTHFYLDHGQSKPKWATTAPASLAKFPGDS